MEGSIRHRSSCYREVRCGISVQRSEQAMDDARLTGVSLLKYVTIYRLLEVPIRTFGIISARSSWSLAGGLVPVDGSKTKGFCKTGISII